MSSSASESKGGRAVRVTVTREALAADLADGRTVIAPLAWYPRLLHATAEERKRWRLIGRGEGIHWPDVDEDISVDALLAGRPSGEGQASFKRWLAARSRSGTSRRTQPARKKAARG